MSESCVKESLDELSASSLIGMKCRGMTGKVECLLARISANEARFAILGVTFDADDFWFLRIARSMSLIIPVGLKSIESSLEIHLFRYLG